MLKSCYKCKQDSLLFFVLLSSVICLRFNFTKSNQVASGLSVVNLYPSHSLFFPVNCHNSFDLVHNLTDKTGKIMQAEFGRSILLYLRYFAVFGLTFTGYHSATFRVREAFSFMYIVEV